MKKIFSAALLGLLIWSSCKEKDVLIDMALKEGITDSTYVGAPESPQKRNVLIEEFTGASCTNCPSGHAVVADLISKNPNRIVAVAYHTYNAGAIFRPVNKPGEKSAYDFRDSTATDISKVIFGGVSSIPIAGIDRTRVDPSDPNRRLFERTRWALEAGNRLNIAPPVNLYLSSEYKTDENKIRLKVKVVYNQTVTTKNTLTLQVLESGIIDAQEYPSYVDMEYEHNHVVRRVMSPFNGYSFLDSVATKQAGRVYEFDYVFTPNPNWKLDKCYLVAFVSNNESDNKEVLQAQQIKVK